MGQALLVRRGARRSEGKEEAARLKRYIGELEGEEEMKSVQAGI